MALLSLTDLRVHFPVKGGVLQRTVAHCRAVDGVSLTLGKGETLGLIGESGCGKTTLGKTIVGLNKPAGGRVEFEGKNITGIRPGNLSRQMQMIFQDPAESLNPRMTVGMLLEEPLLIHGIGSPAERSAKVAALLERVGLSASAAGKYPFEFSGGQRQRIGIARALALQPKFIVCDEPVSALDVSIQAQVLNILQDLQSEYKLTYLFVAHNMSVVEHIADRVGVMYLGKLVEVAPRGELFRNPRHPYTKALMSAIPVPDPRLKRERIILKGDVPSPLNPPAGCRFHTRCPEAIERCKTEEPLLRETSAGHWTSCLLVN